VVSKITTRADSVAMALSVRVRQIRSQSDNHYDTIRRIYGYRRAEDLSGRRPGT
jgi:hypothetical protein